LALLLTPGRAPVRSPSERLPASAPSIAVAGLDTLLAQSSLEIDCRDIARMNLHCADGLPGAEDLNVERCLATLDQWAAHVRAETERHWYRFREHPEAFDHSEGFFRMLMMAVVVYEDFGVRYNPRRIMSPELISGRDGFFADARDVFLHGLVGSRRLGTCSSMPVLYVALGRRLGYPVKLVTTKAHLFVRWESASERLNLEATGKGMNHYDDEHYQQWPFPVTDAEVEADGYLKSLTAAEELAVFLAIRGQCLLESGRLAEAIASFGEATRLAPNVRGYRLLLADAQQRMPGPSPFPSPDFRVSATQSAAPHPETVPVAVFTLSTEPDPLRQINSAPTQ
jgi:hypothetical protein